MKEIYGNAWDLFDSGEFKLLFITSNGTIKKNGDGVMGRGIAAECKNRYIGSDSTLGENLRKYGNCINILVSLEDRRKVVSFPVKHNWHETADIELIIRSCREAMCRTANYPEEKFLLPRPGCGNGGLSWEDVKPMIEPILDDRFYIVHFKEEK